jgi:hypothetical protein
MPNIRKLEPIMLDTDQLYAVMRGLQRHINGKKSHVPKPIGYELNLVQCALISIEREFVERAKEDERIEEELRLLDAEYEGRG